MSNVVVTLATNRIQIFRDATPDELLNSVTYVNVTSVNPLVQAKKRLDGSTPGMSDPTTHPTVTTEDTDWIVELHMADGRIEHINLADVVAPAGWTNDQTGYEQAEEDIYAAFPTGGGGGGGLTDIDGSAVGLDFTGTPSSTVTVADAGVAREAYKAADYYPTFTFSTNTTTAANPGAGFFRFNNATIGSVTEFCISGIAHFEGGDQSVETWLYSWGDALILKRTDVGETDDIIILALNDQIVLTPYLRTAASLTTTIIGGVANVTPPNNSNWRVVSVGDGSINANVNAALNVLSAGKSPAHIVDDTKDASLIIVTITGTTNLAGQLEVDLSVADGDRPAFTDVYFIGGGTTDASAPLVAYPADATLATYTAQYWNLLTAAEDGGGTPVSFTFKGKPA